MIEKYNIAIEEFGRVDRTGWASGPWDNEPDFIEWTVNGTDYLGRIVRHDSMGNLCGYLGVPAGHPWFNEDVDTVGDLYTVVEINYAHSACGGKPADMPVRWWLGFDCGHAWDTKPGMDAYYLSRHREPFSSLLPGTTYKDRHYVAARIEEMALIAKALDMDTRERAVRIAKALSEMPGKSDATHAARPRTALIETLGGDDEHE